MRKTLKEISELIKGEVIGDGSIIITGANGIKEAAPGDITFLANPKYAHLLDTTAASAVITSKEIEKSDKPLIRTDNPSLAFAKVISLISPDNNRHFEGVHSTVVLGKNVKLGKNVALGPYVVIEDGANLGDNVIVYAGSFVGKESSIGKSTLIYPNVSIRERSVIGERVIIHSGTVVGSDGFGFVTIEGTHHKIPQVGSVEIGDEVEIGSNVSIDRARFGKTVIGSGTKIDNLVQIAHNVVIGKNCLIVAQAGISGSTTLGDNVTIAGQAGLSGHITIGDGAIVAAGAGVGKSIPENVMVSGWPARPFNIMQRVNACAQNLPKLFDLVKELKRRIDKLESE